MVACIFCTFHRAACKERCYKSIGGNAYKLTFTTVVIISLFLIVYGWRHTTPVLVYTLPLFVKPVSLILMIVAFLLFATGKHPTRIKSLVRHPQLMSIITWPIAYLLVHGDSRSIVLFGGMGVWAIMEILLINWRDGEWIKEPAPA